MISTHTSLEKKRLLVCVQAVDRHDPLLGFFVSWLEEAAKRFSHITVFALRVGEYTLPKHVTVVSLRSTKTASRWMVIRTLLKEAWLRRHAYDAIFVRGDPHYVLLVGWLWRLLGKKIVFWYAHWKVSVWAVLAHFVAHVTVTSVKAAFDHPWVTPLLIGQSVDHTTFSMSIKPHMGPIRCLIFGSVRPVKRVEVSIQAFLEGIKGGCQATLTIVGPCVDKACAASLHALTDAHPMISWQEGVSYDQVPALLQGYDVLLNACEGSLDKVIIEAMMSGMVVIASTRGMREWLPAHMHWLHAYSVEEMAVAFGKVCALSGEARVGLGEELRTLAIEGHSLERQVEKIERSIV